MSFALWNESTPWQLRGFIAAQDRKFQLAMRQELIELAADRGLVLTPKPIPEPPKLAQPRKSAPRDIISIRQSPYLDVPVTPAQVIIQEICEKHGLTKTELLGPRRAIPIVKARHEAMYRMSKETPMSLPAIGMRMGRDHTTVIYGVRKHAERLAAL